MEMSQGLVENPRYSESQRERISLELQVTRTHNSPDSTIPGGNTLRLQIHFAEYVVTPGLSSSHANVTHDLELVLASWTSVSPSEKNAAETCFPGHL